MKSAKVFFLAILTFIFAFSSLVYADVPQMINYQGKITTPAGALIDDTLSMVFTIYDSSTAGTVLWAETQPSVVVEKGVFSVLLGSVNPIPDTTFTGEVRYLGVKVGADPEMTPRKEIVSVAYAYRSQICDNDWTFRITDTADTTLITGGLWGIARYGNELYGDKDHTHVNLGVASTTGKSGVNSPYCTVGGGYANTASGWHTTVGGGMYNTASGGTVGGGYENTASGGGTTVGGGSGNTASGSNATVGGGASNTASDYWTTVGGGAINTANGFIAIVGGGESNTASGSHATIPGGYGNTVAGDYSFATGDQVNLTSAADYTFAFGYNFTTSTAHAVIFYDASTEMKVGIQTTSPTARLDVNSSTGYNQIRMRTSYTPTGTSDTNGNVGDIAWDDDYFYVKTSAGWKRVALSTW